MAAFAIDNKKGINPIVLHVEPLTSLSEYFVIGSGKTGVQVRAIVQEIERVCKEAGMKIGKIEGDRTSKWVLIDFGDVIVHVFQESERQYYDLETLWEKAKKVPLPKL